MCGHINEVMIATDRPQGIRNLLLFTFECGCNKRIEGLVLYVMGGISFQLPILQQGNQFRFQGNREMSIRFAAEIDVFDGVQFPLEVVDGACDIGVTQSTAILVDFRGRIETRSANPNIILFGSAMRDEHLESTGTTHGQTHAPILNIMPNCQSPDFINNIPSFYRNIIRKIINQRLQIIWSTFVLQFILFYLIISVGNGIPFLKILKIKNSMIKESLSAVTRSFLENQKQKTVDSRSTIASSSQVNHSLANQEDGERDGKFKTQACRYWQNQVECPFGQKCKFAHGNTEMRNRLQKPSRYKTKQCANFTHQGFCTYGTRCQFIHQIKPKTISHQDKLNCLIDHPQKFFVFACSFTSLNVGANGGTSKSLYVKNDDNQCQKPLYPCNGKGQQQYKSDNHVQIRIRLNSF